MKALRVFEKNPVYALINMARIFTAEFQPPSRVDPKTLTGLIKSLSSPLGMVYPLVVVARGDDFFSLIDGHRRHAALTAMGEPLAHCRVLDYEQAEAFAEINGNHRPMRGQDQQEIFLVEPKALTVSQRKNQVTARNYFGDEFYREMTETRGAVLTCLRNECKRVESVLRVHRPQYLRKLSTADLGRKVVTVGSRKIGNVVRTDELSELGKAKRLVELLSQVKA